jgi:hypothetical protein
MYLDGIFDYSWKKIGIFTINMLTFLLAYYIFPTVILNFIYADLILNPLNYDMYCRILLVFYWIILTVVIYNKIETEESYNE